MSVLSKYQRGLNPPLNLVISIWRSDSD